MLLLVSVLLLVFGNIYLKQKYKFTLLQKWQIFTIIDEVAKVLLHCVAGETYFLFSQLLIFLCFLRSLVLKVYELTTFILAQLWKSFIMFHLAISCNTKITKLISANVVQAYSADGYLTNHLQIWEYVGLPLSLTCSVQDMTFGRHFAGPINPSTCFHISCWGYRRHDRDKGSLKWQLFWQKAAKRSQRSFPNLAIRPLVLILLLPLYPTTAQWHLTTWLALCLPSASCNIRRIAIDESTGFFLRWATKYI